MDKRRFIECEILPKLTFEQPAKLLAALYGEGEEFLCGIYNGAEDGDETPQDYAQSQFTVRLFKDKMLRIFAVLRLPDALQEGDCTFIGIRFGKEEEEAPVFRMISSAVGGSFTLCGFEADLAKKEISLAPIHPEKQIEALVASLEPAL
ncbi:MAG: hypothetical protein Q4G07_10235 [Oscillospiraceae bacterium]|nr:hypothetical protein [Oscillospiraceae bacterium]